MYYVYVLQSQKDSKFYTGFTSNLERRIEEHNNKTEFSTKCRAPFSLIYFEGCIIKEDALARERFLKSGKGKKYLKNRTKFHLESLERGGACPVPNFNKFR